jgi:hypothetical protein
MRKKLLALLMCATMVLGTSVSAMALTLTEADYKTAQKIINQGEKFYGEYGDQTLEVINYTNVNADNGKTVTWGFTNSTLTPVKIKKDSTTGEWKALDKLDTANLKDYQKSGSQYTDASGNPVAAISYDNDGNVDHITFLVKTAGTRSGDTYTKSDLVKTTVATGTAITSSSNDAAAVDAISKVSTTVNPSSVLSTALEGSDNGNLVYAGYYSVSDGVDNYVAYITMADDALNYHFITADGDVAATVTGTAVKGLYAAKIAAAPTSAAASITPSGFVKAKTADVKYGPSSLVYTGDGNYINFDADGNIAGYKNVTGTATSSVPEVATADKDGYLSTTNNTSLAKGSKNIVRSDSKETYYVVFTQAGTSHLKDIAAAVNAGTISENAVAVQAHVYKLVNGSAKDSTNNAIKELKSQSVFSSDATFTLDADDFSRTNLKNDSSLAVYTITGDYNDSDKVYRIASLGTTDATGTITFSAGNFNSGIFIFDGAVDESQNDGVSDTTTTTTTTATAATSADTAATSPKTGDVAPIAALAVVMMGACGAMVVASKKRA